MKHGQAKRFGFAGLAAFLAVGVVVALVATQQRVTGGKSGAGPGPREGAGPDASATAVSDETKFALSTLWPDGTMDVCVSAQNGVALSPAQTGDELSATYDEFAGTATGTNLGLSQVEPVVDTECSAEPRFDPSAQDVASTARDWKVTQKGPYDLYIFVYPQSVVDRLGSRWTERIYSYEVLFEEGTSLGVEVSKAIYASAAELADSALRDRVVLTALGVIGPWAPDRPNIDGRCVAEDQSTCSPELLEAEEAQ